MHMDAFCAQREVVIWEVVVLSSIIWLYEKMIWRMTVIMSTKKGGLDRDEFPVHTLH